MQIHNGARGGQRQGHGRVEKQAKPITLLHSPPSGPQRRVLLWKPDKSENNQPSTAAAPGLGSKSSEEKVTGWGMFAAEKTGRRRHGNSPQRRKQGCSEVGRDQLVSLDGKGRTGRDKPFSRGESSIPGRRACSSAASCPGGDVEGSHQA